MDRGQDISSQNITVEIKIWHPNMCLWHMDYLKWVILRNYRHVVSEKNIQLEDDRCGSSGGELVLSSSPSIRKEGRT
jgi:hypothetical protein